MKVWLSSESPSGETPWYVDLKPGRYALARQRDLTISRTRRTLSKAITTIDVDPSVQYQSILGFGSSLEEATVFNLARMSPKSRKEILKKWVTSDGAGMNLMRICFGTSDFTGQAWYSYDDMPAGQTDPKLKHFSIDKDTEYQIIPTLKEALRLNPRIKIFASPWSPPGWMKDSGQMTGGTLLPQYYKVAAQYYRKAIQAYAAKGIPIYAFTLQNEPLVDVTTYPSAKFTWEQERDFLKVVKKEFRSAGLKTKLWILDHNFDMAMTYAAEILKDKEAYRAVDGIAFHHYVGDPEEMSRLKKAFPEKKIYFSEGALFHAKGMDSLVQYLRNWASSYDSWVSVLDTNRKPNNGPFSPDATPITIQEADKLDNYRLTPAFYMIAQFSKFIRPGARRIKTDYGSQDSVTDVAFRNPDGKTVLVAVNQTSEAQAFRVHMRDDGDEFDAKLPAKTVGTYIW